MIVLPVLSLHSLPVFAELEKAGLITSKEREELQEPDDVLWAQNGKSPEVLLQSAKILMTYSCETEANLLAGKQMDVQ